MAISKREAAKREKWLFLAEELWYNGQRAKASGVLSNELEQMAWLFLFATVLPLSFGEQLAYFCGVGD